MKHRSLKKVLYLTGALLALTLYGHVAWAAENNMDPQQVLSAVLDYLTGAFGKTIAAIAFVVTGLGSMVMGRFSRSWFYGVVVGIIIVFGSNFILTDVLQVGTGS